MRAGLIVAGMVAALALTPPGARLREDATDLLMRALPRPDSGAPVLALAITEADLAAQGAWPWPRERIAVLVAQLAAAGAAAIALDIVFTQPSEGDAALALALESTPAVLAALGGTQAPRPTFGIAELGADLSQVLVVPGVEASVPTLPAPSGFAALPGEVVRSVPVIVRVGDTVVPGFAMLALARALGATTLILRGDPPMVQAGSFLLEVPADHALRLHPAAQLVPAISVAELQRDPSVAARRVVVVGVVAPAVAGPRGSVFGLLVPSLRIHAEAVAQLAGGWVPHRPSVAPVIEPVAALAMGGLAAVATMRGPLVGLAAALAMAGAWVALAGGLLRLGPLLLDPLLPAAAPFVAGLVQAAAQAVRAAKQRADLLRRFVHRLPAGIAAQLLELPGEERLRPERRTVTVVLTDLAGFTAMVQRVDPGALVPFLNAYLSGIESVGTARGGVPERLTGDGVLLVFGAPVAQDDHAARALAAARAIDAFAEGFRRLPDIMAMGWGSTRITVASGEVLAGEVGGARVTWTVYGDAVNVASRLQDVARETGDRVLVTGIADPELKPRGTFTLRGREGEVVVATI